MATKNQVNIGLSGETGTGSFVGNNSPTLVTPVLGAATATSINFGGSTLNTYAENTAWTPVLSFATPGDLSVSYAAQSGTYTRIGNSVILTFTLLCTPTYTTASGELRITGLPFTANASVPATIGSCGITATTFPAGATSPALLISGGVTYVNIIASGAGVAVNVFSTTNLPTALALLIYGTITYLV